VNYCVMDIHSKGWMANSEGVMFFANLEAAKNAGVWAGRSFVVVGDANPQKQLLCGLMTSMGFVIVDDTLQGGNTSREPEAAGSSPVEADQDSVRPLV